MNDLLLLQSTHLHRFEHEKPSFAQKQYLEKHFLFVHEQPTFFLLYFC